jgi:hypothetical protein
VKRFLFFGFLSMCTTLTLIFCGKSEVNSNLSIKLTDAPSAFEIVNIDVRSVEIHFKDLSKGNNGWVTLNTAAGIYDLMQLRNNKEVHLVNNFEVPSGSTDSIKLNLGNNNSLYEQGVAHKMIISKDNQNCRIRCITNLKPNNGLTIVLDLDAEKSISTMGNNDFYFTPVLMIKSISQ